MILITGAGGLVGTQVAQALNSQPIRLAMRKPRDGAVRFDFHDPSTFGPALDGVDRVFLLRPPQLAHAKHDFGPFIAAMAAARVEQVVFLSVRGAERNPLLPHHRIERLIEASGLAWTHLRPNDFMQNFLKVHCDDIERGTIVAPAGRGRTSFVDVRDVGAAAAAVLTSEGHCGRAYTLTGPEALDLFDVAQIFSEVLGRAVIYRPTGALRYLLRQRRTHGSLAFALVMTGVSTIARLGLAAAVTSDFKQLTGRSPGSFRGFVTDHVESWRTPCAS